MLVSVLALIAGLTSCNKEDKPKTYTLEPNSRRYALPIYNQEIINAGGKVQQNVY